MMLNWSNENKIRFNPSFCWMLFIAFAVKKWVPHFYDKSFTKRTVMTK